MIPRGAYNVTAAPEGVRISALNDFSALILSVRPRTCQSIPALASSLVIWRVIAETNMEITFANAH